MSDSIRVNDLSLTVPLLSGAQWPRDKPSAVEQPITISLVIFHDVSQAAQTDDLSLSLNYAIVAKHVRRSIELNSFQHLQSLARHITDALSQILEGGTEVQIKLVQLRSPLHTKTVGIEYVAKFHSDRSWAPSGVTYFVEDLVCPAIIGVNPAEREEKQDVVVNLAIKTGEDELGEETEVDLRNITKSLYETICSSNFQTLEALTSLVASKTLSLLRSFQPAASVLVRVAKPSALIFAGSAEVQIRRTFDDYPDDNIPQSHSLCSLNHPHTAAIALGSNLGDSFHNIEYALRLLEDPLQVLKDENISVDTNVFVDVVNTSFLYETKPMYVTDQPSFINGSCIVATDLLPVVLLQLLKAIERKVGRVPSIRNGPRAVDLDIIFYDDEIIDTRKDTKDIENLDGTLVVPHPRMQEREFVLRPLNDIIPDYLHPVFKKTVETLFHEVCDPKSPPMKKVLYFPQPPLSQSTQPSSTQCFWTYSSNRSSLAPEKFKTHLMATVNVTPDSFSDGDVHSTLSAALSYVPSSIAAGATIIDVGGYSTRPGAEFVSVEDEINRVVPVIEAIRDRSTLRSFLKNTGIASKGEEALEHHIERIVNVPISIDTFRWQVAEAAIQAGANSINDVYAFTGPDYPVCSMESSDEVNEYMLNMKAVARKYAVPVVLMHSRGEAGLNKDYGSFGYAADGKIKTGRGAVLEGVRVELGSKVNRIVLGKGGLRRWSIIVDPGIGFSKSVEGNLELLRSARDIVADVHIGNDKFSQYRNPLRGFPLLIGASRKSFLGAILAQGPASRQTEPKERGYATAVTVSCAVQQNALAVRVHDVREMMDIIKVAEALYF